MPAKFISRRKSVETTVYRLNFSRIDDPGSGYIFDCDEAGVVDRSKLLPAGVANLDACLRGDGVGRGRIQPVIMCYVHSAVIECDCGMHLTLNSSWANECDCGLEYNGSGQMLAPRDQWGEETGEVFS